KLLFQAQFKKDLQAALKVKIALSMYGPQLNPIINEIYGRIPLDQMAESSALDWEHLSDYTHHKLLLVGNRSAQLGGRNIENSYHMKKNSLSAKYIFMDTDIAFKIKENGDLLIQTFQELWNFKERVIELGEVLKLMPNDFISNTEAFKLSLMACQPTAYKTAQDRANFSECLKTQIKSQPNYLNQSQRLEQMEVNLNKKSNIYWTNYYPQIQVNETWKKSQTSVSKDYDDSISSQDIESMIVSYIENLPYNRNLPVQNRKRLYGSQYGNDLLNGKEIHHLWQKGLEDTCKMASKKSPQRVILHSAYFLPSSGLMRTFAKMMDGTLNCRYVRVTFLTNSIATTDLNIINAIARYQFLAFYQILKQKAEGSAQFELFEYLPTASGPSNSLHTKLSLFGDQLIIGSANADVRSYYMDTNNGFYLRNAKSLIADYTQWVDSLLQDSQKTRNLSSISLNNPQTITDLFTEDALLIEGLLKRYNYSDRIKPETKATLITYANKIGAFVYDRSLKIFSDRFIEVPGQEYFEEEQTRKKEQLEIMKEFDRWLQLF
ncbi:MAG TPA: hypothetical protein PLJ21_09480, partial [Pseudobdellovibrionaceae bacterium]|nr:hypothetical protein [Pseudobdellovibrionaceae bacterium]